MNEITLMGSLKQPATRLADRCVEIAALDADFGGLVAAIDHHKQGLVCAIGHDGRRCASFKHPQGTRDLA
ncbi:hypothetical protein ACVOMS_15070 [Bradyrhizobium guangxiense]